MEEMFVPCEERVLLSSGRKCFRVSIPAEDSTEDTRMPLTPQGVEVLVAQGHEVVVENNAGFEARFSNKQYAEAGARIVDNKREAYSGDIVLKMSLPKAEELKYISDKQTIVSFILQNDRGNEVYKALASKGCNILALDFLSDGNEEPVVTRCLGEIEGMLAVTTAANLLERSTRGKGIIIGGVTGVPPTEIVIIGSGAAATSAARTASAFGATVKVFDSQHSHLQELARQLPNHIFTSILHPQALAKAFTSADVVIGTRAIPGHYPFFASDEMMSLLKSGAVAVDLNVNLGGRFDTSEPTTIQSQTYVRCDVIHHCLQDITVLAPHTATIMLSDILTPVITEMAASGSFVETVKRDFNFSRGVVMLDGVTTNEYVAKRFNTDYYDMKLLIF